ncbi:MAG: hypothetical protein JSV12_06985 [Candidatus Bathyarchaeota archaeon]|nr:MAG: hypothetical protein JSV12_06985 [Candidatus Bathyarchaeota archaeon]
MHVKLFGIRQLVKLGHNRQHRRNDPAIYCVGHGKMKEEKKEKNEETIIVVRADRCIIKQVEIKEPKLSKVKRFFKAMAYLMYQTLYGCVLLYFKSVNRRAKSSIILWYMKCETLEHVNSLIKVFKWVVLPASFIYVFVNFYFFGENALDSMFLGILIFFYSNFLPDIPSIYRRKKSYGDIRVINKDLSWEKKYALLLFAPLFIWVFFCGILPRWKITETFHNFKSLTIYVAFLLLLSFFVFGDFPISIGNITEILSLPFYGLIGYLTHLRVDKMHKWVRV